MNLAIVGGRDFTDRKKFNQIVDEWLEKNGWPDSIISGGATGVDSMAERYAEEKKIPFVKCLPEWNAHGKAAGPMRNTQIVNAATHMIAMPTKNSTGTYDSIRKAEKKKISVSVYNV